MAAYLDNMVVYSQTWAEHLDCATTVLQSLQEVALTINLAKCNVVKTETTCVWIILGNGQIWLLEGKVQVLQRFPTLNTKTQVYQFLGLARYYRQLIPASFSIARPLTDLPKGDHLQKVQWGGECTQAF